MPLAELVVSALGIALNPFAVIAAILLLLSPSHPARKGVAFLLGWMTGILLVAVLVVVFGDVAMASGAPSAIASGIRLAVGALLMVLAVQQWRKGRSEPDAAELPEWMRSLTELSAPRAFLTALLFAALNPKTLVLNIAGVLAIVEAWEGLAAQATALLTFVAIASVTVALPVIYYLVTPRRAATALDRLRVWLIAHNAAIVAVVLLVLGALLLAAGLEGLLAG